MNIKRDKTYQARMDGLKYALEIKQLAKDKREIMSEEELVLLLCIVQDDTRHQHQDLEMCKVHGLDAAETVKSRIVKNAALEKKLKQLIAEGTIR